MEVSDRTDSAQSQVAPQPPAGWTRKPGDGWVDCACGQRHWGKNGAAGLFLARQTEAGHLQIALQHRALWSHQGGTWSIPGGAIMDGESAQDAALREAFEEAGITSEDVNVIGQVAMKHTDWTYTTFVALLGPKHGARLSSQLLSPTDTESIEVRWIDLAQLLAPTPSIPLHPAFHSSLKSITDVLRTHM